MLLPALFLAITLVDIVKIVVVLAVIGFLIHLVVTHVPISPPVKQIIVVVIVLLLLFWFLERWGGALSV